MSRNYIIGAGITGLVWKFYHPDFQIISPQIGGDYGKTHMVWIHDCFETRKLLIDLGFPIKTKKSWIGYYYKGWITENLSNDMNLVMIQKKMTEWNKPIDPNFVPKTRDLSLSSGLLSGVNYMNTLDVDLIKVVEKLNEKSDVKHGFVTRIDEDRIFVKQNPKDESGNWLLYDKLISTISAPFFWKAWGQEKEFKYLSITNIITDKKPEFFDNRYEMVYYDDSVPFSRISFLDGKYALEFTGIITREEFEEKFPDLPVLDYFIVPQGRIFENEENLSPTPNIIFSGRFAQWKYGVTSEYVISQAINYKN